MERVRAAGGSASIASSFFLDLVFATGRSCCIVAAMARAVRSRRFRACALFLVVFVACCCCAPGVGIVVGGVCCCCVPTVGPTMCTLGGDCSSFLLLMDLVILASSWVLSFSASPPSEVVASPAGVVIVCYLLFVPALAVLVCRYCW